MRTWNIYDTNVAIDNGGGLPTQQRILLHFRLTLYMDIIWIKSAYLCMRFLYWSVYRFKHRIPTIVTHHFLSN